MGFLRSSGDMSLVSDKTGGNWAVSKRRLSIILPRLKLFFVRLVKAMLSPNSK